MSANPVYAVIRRKSGQTFNADGPQRRQKSSPALCSAVTSKNSCEDMSNSLPLSASASALDTEQMASSPGLSFASSAPDNSAALSSAPDNSAALSSAVCGRENLALLSDIADDVERLFPTQPRCPVCYRPPHDPRLLPCLHSLCKRCLDELITKCVASSEEDGESVLHILCPVCRHKCPLSSGGQSRGFPSDFASRNSMLQSTLGCAQVECSMCDETIRQPVTAQCSTCKALLCRTHACSHPLSKGSAHHIVLDVQDRTSSVCSTPPRDMSPKSSSGRMPTQESSRELPSSNGMKLSPLNQSQRSMPHEHLPCLSLDCPTLLFDVCRVEGHEGEPLRLFCRPCDRFLCFECFAKEHMTHTCISAKSIIEQKRRKIQEALEALRTNIMPLYTSALGSFKSEQNNLAEKADAVRVEIHEAEEAMKMKTTEFSQQLLRQVDDIEDSRGKYLERQHEDVSEHIKSMKAAIQFTDMALTHCVGVDLLPVCTLLEQRLDELQAATVSLKPSESSGLVFKSPRSPPPLEDCIGVVANSLASPQFCRVTGLGKSRAMPCKPSVVTVVTYDIQGERVNVGGDCITAKWITRESCDSDTLISLPITSIDDVPVLAITDHKNGQYSITYTLKETGTYMLSLCINYEPLPESPFHIDCSHWCFDADLCSEHILLLSNRQEAVKVKGSMNNDFLVGNFPLLSGKHKWKVIINSAPYWVAAGVTKKPAYDASTSWGWSSVAHELSDSEVQDVALERWQEKDTLVLELDCVQHTLTMTNLRSGRIHTISRLPETELYPWFVLYKQGDSIRIQTDCGSEDV